MRTSILAFMIAIGALLFRSAARTADGIFSEHGTFYVAMHVPDHIRASYTLTEKNLEKLKGLLVRSDSWTMFLYERELQFSAARGEMNSRIGQLVGYQSTNWAFPVAARFLRQFRRWRLRR